jgi:hypothetical protein
MVCQAYKWHICAYFRIQICTCTYPLTYMPALTHTNKHEAPMFSQMHTCIHTCAHSCMHSYIHTNRQQMFSLNAGMCIYNICTCASFGICTDAIVLRCWHAQCTHTHAHTSLHAYTNERTYKNIRTDNLYVILEVPGANHFELRDLLHACMHTVSKNTSLPTFT